MSDYQLESVSSNQNLRAPHATTIRVIGVGGGGGNAIQYMINQSLGGVEFLTVNTDAQALSRATSHTIVQIGEKLTHGLGAGCNPNVGREAAEESRNDIKKLLEGSDMVFVTAGMGGGTGTGAAPIIAEVAKELGALTVGVVTKPFKFEGKRHMVNAQQGISELSKKVDSIIVIDNDNLLRNLGANVSISNAFNEANDVLLNAVKGITDSILSPGFINIDFNDVIMAMKGRGNAMIGNGIGKGANFVEDAIQKAIHSPLIEQVDISSASGLLVNVRVNPNFPINKWEDVSNAIQSYASDDSDSKFGLIWDDKLEEDEIHITIIITGISGTDYANNTEAPAAVARAQGAIRRNAAIQARRPTGFFNMSQQGQEQNATLMQQQHVSQVQNPSMADAADDSNPFAPRPQISEVTPAPIEEVKIDHSLSKSNEESELWDIPAVLRNRAD